ncbi:MAG TPA: M64 family metallopeptidase, partial [candidate division Zixibacteria bacterium]|nr:M64 family metallopeptidase [candidate division Zixibacteria bacterium]
MKKSVVTPGLAGAPVRPGYRAEWLDASGSVLSATTVELPLGVRSAFEEGLPCEQLVPDAGSFTIRLAGPAPSSWPTALRLRRQSLSRATGGPEALPPAFEAAELILPVALVPDGLGAPQGPISSSKLRDVGPDENRLVFVFMGDGYTAANLAAGDFDNDVQTVLSGFLGFAPWDVLLNATNVYQVDVESNEEGSDNDPKGTYVDTYFNSTFWTGGIERAVTIDGTGYSRAFSAADAAVGAGLWDEIVILVNSTKYGGTGGSVSVISMSATAPWVAIHEYGHTFAGLADEYAYDGSGPPSYTPEPNVDLNFNPPKWSVWIEPGTPLPTPAAEEYVNVVGAFEGAAYWPSDVYRPWRDCAMRSTEFDFGPICKETHVIRFTDIVELADEVYPATPTVLLDPDGITFDASLIPFLGITTQWTINGEAPTCGHLQSLALSSDDLPENTNTVRLTVRYPTPWVRQDSIVNTYDWLVIRDCNGNGVNDSLDILAGAPDANANGVIDFCESAGCCLTPGDANGNGVLNIADVTYLLSYIFSGGPPPDCDSEGDADGSGTVNIGDVTYVLAFIFSGGPSPVCLSSGSLAWRSPPCSLPQDMHALWGSGPDDVFAVGNLGTILHYGGVGWGAVPSGSGEQLTGVWGSAPDDVFAVGLNAGEVLHFNGSSWSLLYDAPISLTDIWGLASNDVYATGFGTVLHFDGSVWTNANLGVFGYLNALWGSGPDNIVAVGSGGAIRRYNGSTWSSQSSGTSAFLYDVWGSDANNIIAVGAGGAILRYNGSQWSSEPSGVTASLFAIWGYDAANVFVSGAGGLILRYSNGSW